MIKKIVVLATLACSLSFGGGIVSSTQPEKPVSKKLWWASVAAVTAASVFDAGSSWNKQELNPLLRTSNGRFGARGIEIKSAIVGASIVCQWLGLRHHPRMAKSLSILNLSVAGVTAGAAAHNMR
jgi:hypothetical protein